MQIDWDNVRVYIKPGATDMRKQYNGLAHMVTEVMGKDIYDGSLYVFCNRDRSILRILYWERNGLCLWTKRLERQRFPWPKDEQAARQISREYFWMLLRGIDIFREHEEIKIFKAS